MAFLGQYESKLLINTNKIVQTLLNLYFDAFCVTHKNWEFYILFCHNAEQAYGKQMVIC